MKFQIGDRVRVLRKAKSNERGWQNSWISSSMDRAVGRIGVITYINPTVRHDIEVRVQGIPLVWGYPSFVLKLEPKKKKAKK